MKPRNTCFGKQEKQWKAGHVRQVKNIQKHLFRKARQAREGRARASGKQHTHCLENVSSLSEGIELPGLLCRLCEEGSGRITYRPWCAYARKASRFSGPMMVGLNIFDPDVSCSMQENTTYNCKYISFSGCFLQALRKIPPNFYVVAVPQAACGAHLPINTPINSSNSREGEQHEKSETQTPDTKHPPAHLSQAVTLGERGDFGEFVLPDVQGRQSSEPSQSSTRDPLNPAESPA